MVRLEENLDYKAIVDEYLEKYGRSTTVILPVLEKIQETYNYIPIESIEYLAHKLKISPAVIYSTATFYHFFSLEPKGEVIIRVCRGTACHVMGSGLIMRELIDELKLEDEGTTPDGKFTLESVGCIGCCSTGPNIVVIKDGKETVYGYMTPQKSRELVKQLVQELNSETVGGR